MDKKYSDSLMPSGIGTSFCLILAAFIAAGAAAGFLLNDSDDFQQLGGISLLAVFLALLAGPALYNKRKSRFEKDREVLEEYNGAGTIQGLRGVFFRLLIYEDGIEIRAFYHRYFIPYNRIQKLSIRENNFSTVLNFPTGIDKIPDRIVSSSSGFQAISLIIQRKTKPGHL